MFYGVPHFGSPLAVNDPRAMGFFSDALAAPLLRDLSPNSPPLIALDARFCDAARGATVAIFGESRTSPVALGYSAMVRPFPPPHCPRRATPPPAPRRSFR